MKRFVSNSDLEKMYNFVNEICQDCCIRGQACYGCDIYYDKYKFEQIMQDFKKGENHFERK